MHQYGVRDVERLLGLPRTTVRSLIAAGFVSPARGPGRAWRFTFQDLIVLRTAQALAAANVPHRRITQTMKELRRRLPEAMPLSGLSICAVGDRVAVKEGGNRWQADSGQYLLAFEGDPTDGSLSIIDSTRGDIGGSIGSAHSSRDMGGARAMGALHGLQVEGDHTPGSSVPSRDLDADELFEMGVALEEEDAEAALQAYERAIAADPAHLDARLNLGRLLHEAGRHAKAERVYREAKNACGSDPVLLYNLGVLLEDMGRRREAIKAYESALRGNAGLADCHYNLALIYEDLKKPKDAIRHMAQYRKLMKRDQ